MSEEDDIPFRGVPKRSIFGKEFRVKISRDYKKCVDEAEEKALYWLWLKKTGQEKVFEAFNDVRDKIEECELIKKKKG